MQYFCIFFFAILHPLFVCIGRLFVIVPIVDLCEYFFICSSMDIFFSRIFSNVTAYYHLFYISMCFYDCIQQMPHISCSYFILCKHVTYDSEQQRLTATNEIACLELYYDICDFCFFANAHGERERESEEKESGMRLAVIVLCCGIRREKHMLLLSQEEIILPIQCKNVDIPVCGILNTVY